MPPTISEENGGASADASAKPSPAITPLDGNGHVSANQSYRLKRTPKALYRVNDEETPLLAETDSNSLFNVGIPAWEPEDEPDSQSRIVSVAIYNSHLFRLGSGIFGRCGIGLSLYGNCMDYYEIDQP